MNLVLFFIALLTIGSIETAKIEPSENSWTEWEAKKPALLQKVIYFGVGTTFGVSSVAARIGWGLSFFTPWFSTIGKECLLFSRLSGCISSLAFKEMAKGSFSLTHPSGFYGIPYSQSSWHKNQQLLARIPAPSIEEQRLLEFLQQRWLSKSSGFISLMVDWVCPLFGISIQVHPATTHSYARDLRNHIPENYRHTMENWKQLLPHPLHYPLILTRPFDVHDYLPSYLPVPPCEDMETFVEKTRSRLEQARSQVLLDLTSIFPDEIKDRNEWLQAWESYRNQFARACAKRSLNTKDIICIQRLKKEEVGGIRLLPLTIQSQKEMERQQKFLIQWSALFGLSANSVELDRCSLSTTSTHRQKEEGIAIPFQPLEQFFFYLRNYNRKWRSTHPQKTLMVISTIKLLEGLFLSLPEEKWEKIKACPTRFPVVQLAFLQIQDRLEYLARCQDKISFSELGVEVELLHAHLSSLLEICSPFDNHDFLHIHRDLLTSTIPNSLKQFTSYALHSSAMTSLGGIFNAVEKTIKKTPHVLYGENTYFECITAAKSIAHLKAIEAATEEDWKQADLILGQFNPVLRIDPRTTEYRTEKIADVLHRCLKVNREKPLTLALDCTLDFINSSKAAQLLTEFEEEIHAGRLSVICYRSGLKFDLFGMDNYCGAPFVMIHNKDKQWDLFDPLVTDPALATDRLSVNWFCLAYQNTAPELELYRKYIFDNTRALLNRLPSRLLYGAKARYRVIPVEDDALAAFIDIKISGPLHKIKGAALVAGNLYTECLNAGYPIFTRLSLGFFNPNFFVTFEDEVTSIRLTLGLDPTQVELFAKCLETIDALNGPIKQAPKKRLLPNLAPRLASSSLLFLCDDIVACRH